MKPLNESLEITYGIGCRVGCLKYCPQEIFVKRYRGPKFLTLENCKKFTISVPHSVEIISAGMNEPFLNPETPSIMMWFHETGYRQSGYTTLDGLTMENARMLSEIPFDRFVIHLPDYMGNSNIRVTDEWCRVFGYVSKHFSGVEYMSMGKDFVSNRGEDYFRNKHLLPHKSTYNLSCIHFEKPTYTMNPDGSMYFCCMCKGMEQRIGSLETDRYFDLRMKFQHHVIGLKADSESICHYCTLSEPTWKKTIRNFIDRKTGCI